MKRLIFITSLLVITTACATVPRTGPRPEDQRLTLCAVDPNCFLVKVENVQSRFDVRVYVNQSYLGFIPATKTETFPMRRSVLDGSLCGAVRVHQISGTDRYSARDCARPGWHFSIQIQDNGIWFSPWPRKT